MVTFRKSVAALAALLTVATLAGCVTGPKLNPSMTGMGSDRLQILWLHAYKDKQGVRLLGHVRRNTGGVGPVGGHLHVVGYFADGSPPLVADTRWGTLPRRGGGMASFSILLRTLRPDHVERITLEHRPNSRDAAF